MTTINPLKSLKKQLEKVIIGQEALLERIIIALLAGGHVLLEGPPGLAKTTTVHALAMAINADFHRIQFTPDLMPSDLTGSEIYQPENQQFRFIAGPLFNHLVLADEINRAPPKVQSALLEAMAESQVTIGNHTHVLNDLFIVLATQNPLEQFGTYPLPEALLDRFLFKLNLDYPEKEAEVLIARSARQNSGGHLVNTVTPLLDPDDILDYRQKVNDIHVDPLVEDYAVRLVAATRQVDDLIPEWKSVVLHGASPRGSITLLRTAMARAFYHSRDFVVPEDIIELAPDVLRHRISLEFSAANIEITNDTVIEAIIRLTEAP